MIGRVLLAAIAFAIAGCASTTRPGSIGVERQQLLIVPAATVERMALAHYTDQYSKAKAAGRLIESGPEYDRLKMIGGRLIRQTAVFRDDTRHWKWHLSLIDAPVLNASCSPGGKITFYTGIIRKLSLTDDEIAAVMGHEIAHAIREHGREKVSEAIGQQLVVSLAAAGTKSPEQNAALANQVAQILYTLPHSREKEAEADKIGLELMARAGYDPRAAINVWRKMSTVSGQSTPEFMSTHPSHASRIAELTALQPIVQPLYSSARNPNPPSSGRAKGQFAPLAPPQMSNDGLCAFRSCRLPAVGSRPGGC